jgi:hypothetical protein
MTAAYVVLHSWFSEVGKIMKQAYYGFVGLCGKISDFFLLICSLPLVFAAICNSFS